MGQLIVRKDPACSPQDHSAVATIDILHLAPADGPFFRGFPHRSNKTPAPVCLSNEFARTDINGTSLLLKPKDWHPFCCLSPQT